jgi:hypothetical protein
MASVFTRDFILDLSIPPSDHIDHPFKNMPVEDKRRLFEVYTSYVEDKVKAFDCDDMEHCKWVLLLVQLHRFAAVVNNTTEEQVDLEKKEYIQEGFELSRAQHYERLIYQGLTAAGLEERFRNNSLALPHESEESIMFQMFAYLMWEFTNTVRKITHKVLVELPSVQEAEEPATKRPREEA